MGATANARAAVRNEMRDRRNADPRIGIQIDVPAVKLATGEKVIHRAHVVWARPDSNWVRIEFDGGLFPRGPVDYRLPLAG